MHRTRVINLQLVLRM